MYINIKLNGNKCEEKNNNKFLMTLSKKPLQKNKYSYLNSSSTYDALGDVCGNKMNKKVYMCDKYDT